MDSCSGDSYGCNNRIPMEEWNNKLKNISSILKEDCNVGPRGGTKTHSK